MMATATVETADFVGVGAISMEDMTMELITQQWHKVARQQYQGTPVQLKQAQAELALANPMALAISLYPTATRATVTQNRKRVYVTLPTYTGAAITTVIAPAPAPAPAPARVKFTTALTGVQKGNVHRIMSDSGKSFAEVRAALAALDPAHYA